MRHIDPDRDIWADVLSAVLIDLDYDYYGSLAASSFRRLKNLIGFDFGEGG